MRIIKEVNISFINMSKSLKSVPHHDIFLIELIIVHFPPYIAKVGLLGKTEDKSLYGQIFFDLIHVIYRIL